MDKNIEQGMSNEGFCTFDFNSLDKLGTGPFQMIIDDYWNEDCRPWYPVVSKGSASRG